MLCEGVLVPTENDAADVVKPGQNKLKQPPQFRSQARIVGMRLLENGLEKENKITTSTLTGKACQDGTGTTSHDHRRRHAATSSRIRWNVCTQAELHVRRACVGTNPIVSLCQCQVSTGLRKEHFHF
jgi:hypothetical protein